MKVLDPYVDRLLARWPGRRIPRFDERDGASGARVLFLLEAPGPGAVASNRISRHNNDRTAANMNALLAQAGIQDAETALWNAVPWYIGNSDASRIRPARVADLREAAEGLAELLGLLPRLRAVVLVGRKAQHRSVVEVIERSAPAAAVFTCVHPSPLALNGRPERREQLLQVLQRVRATLNARGAGAPEEKRC